MPVPARSGRPATCAGELEGAVDRVPGQEVVEVGEVRVEQPGGDAGLAGHGPAGEPARPVAAITRSTAAKSCCLSSGMATPRGMPEV